MQEPRSTSTLELVVNEQQLNNMSQIDLHLPSDQSNQANQQQSSQTGKIFSLDQLKRWRARFRESFHAKMDEAKSNSESRTEFFLHLLRAFSGTLIWFLCFICTIIVPVILFVIGLISLDDCSDRPALPYMIFATGFAMTASNLINLALALDLPILTNHQLLSSDIKNTIASIINIIFNCVVVFLFILSSFMVYNMGSTRAQSNGDDTSGTRDERASNEVTLGCNSLLYYFTYWFITLTLSLVVILSAIAAILYIYNRYRLAIVRGSTSRSQASAAAYPTGLSATDRV